MIGMPTSPGNVEIPSDEERARQHLIAEREYERGRRLDAVLFVLQCIGSCVLGLFFIGYAMHTTDMGWAGVSFYGGLVLGNAGILLSLVRYHTRAQHRGDL